MDAYSIRMLDELNSTPVSVGKVIEVVEVIGELEPGDRDFTSHYITIVRLNEGEPMICKSIMFRLEALAFFLKNEGAPGWTITMPDGGVLTQEAVFAAAAVHPMISEGNHFAFERESFLNKILELADLDQIG